MILQIIIIGLTGIAQIITTIRVFHRTPYKLVSRGFFSRWGVDGVVNRGKWSLRTTNITVTTTGFSAASASLFSRRSTIMVSFLTRTCSRTPFCLEFPFFPWATSVREVERIILWYSWYQPICDTLDTFQIVDRVIFRVNETMFNNSGGFSLANAWKFRQFFFRYSIDIDDLSHWDVYLGNKGIQMVSAVRLGNAKALIQSAGLPPLTSGGLYNKCFSKRVAKRVASKILVWWK